MQEEKQPFSLNHDGKSKLEIFGITQQQARDCLKGDVFADLPFAIFIYGVFTKEHSVGVLVGTILTQLVDTDLLKPTRC